MTVATLNPFDLLNEEVKPVKAVTKTVPVATAVTTKSAEKLKENVIKRNKTENNKAVINELNPNVNEKTPLRNNNSRRTAAPTGNERQERRRTDRHSRTGYKQDGEKRMNGGKGSWGKAVEGNEQHVSVDESVAIVEEQVESLEITETFEAVENVEAAAPVIAHLTLAQYQASLKKPAGLTSSTPRKVTTSLPPAQILKKESDVFVFPEIVKKAPVKKGKASAPVAVAVDVSKYISVKAVASVEPRETRDSREKRDNRDSRDNRNRENRNNPRDNRNSRQQYQPQQPQQSHQSQSQQQSKLNLKDDRSFPTLGAK